MTVISNDFNPASLTDSGRNANGREFLTFSLDGREYAVNITAIKAVVGLTHITPVPLMPPCVLGVISLRGTVVPIIDLAVKFGGSATGATKRTCIVIVEPHDDEEMDGERTQVGLIAQSVGSVVEFGSEDLTIPPAFGTKVQANYLAGLGRTPNGFVMILDIDRALSTEELLNEGPRQTIDAIGNSQGSLPAGSSGIHDKEAA